MWRIFAVLLVFLQITAFGRVDSLSIYAFPQFTFWGGLFDMPGTIHQADTDDTFSVDLRTSGTSNQTNSTTINKEARLVQSGKNVEELVGPFPSWANLKTWYGAVGDGNSDDTQALQNALNDLGKTGKSSVLYFPAGTYKITNQLDLSKAKNVAIVGQSPDLVTLSWAGASGGTILRFQNDSHTKVQGVTFDGNNTASNGLWIRWDGKTDNFPTTFDISDNIFKNLQVGIRGGKSPTDDGHQDTAAEVSINRNKFIGNSTAGIVLKDWNTVDWWIRNSLFENNNLGVKGIVGVFHVSDSVFKNSTSGDIFAKDNSFIGLRNNYSIGSPYFYQTGGPTSGGQIATIQNNKILDSTDTAIQIKTPGPVTLLDNTIRNRAGNPKPAVNFGGLAPGNLVAIGNSFSAQNPFGIDLANNRFLNLDTSVAEIAASEPVLPTTPQQATAPVIEVDTLTGVSVQAAINRAVRDYSGQRPIVHLPSGKYDVTSTIAIPAGSDVRLIGDSGFLAGPGASVLSWTGTGVAPVLSIQGPSHAVVQDIAISGGPTKVQGVAINNVDRPSGRILLNQTNVNPFSGSTTGVALRVEGLDYTTVDAINTSIGGDRGAINVLGGPQAMAGQPTTARVQLYGGTYGSFGSGPSYNVDKGGHLIVRDVWYENGGSGGRRTPTLQLSGSGTVTLDNMKQAYPGNAAGSTPTIGIDGFSGQLTLNGIEFSGAVNEVKGNNPETNILILDSILGSPEGIPPFSSSASAGQVSLLQNAIPTSNGVVHYPNQGTTDPTWLRSMLATLRQEKLADRSLPLPSDVTDLTLLRVGLENVSDGFIITP
jgi:Pectate lyase superfamily protein